MTTLTLVSHHLCPYVQRAAIALDEKGAAFERIEIDLAAKPDWFLAVSPLGKVPLLMIGGTHDSPAVLFESSAILEYLDETVAPRLHPIEPLERARHRGWIEYGSALLDRIARLYNAPDEAALQAAAAALRAMFVRLEAELGQGPWFAGSRFSLVDAVFAPVFRYFEVIDRDGALGILDGLPRLEAWRRALAARPAVRRAVAPDFACRLHRFLKARNGALAALLPIEPEAKQMTD